MDNLKARVMASLRQGRATEVIPLLRRTLRQSPGSGELHEMLGMALESTGQRSAALDHLREAARLAPASATTWINLGAMLARTRDYGKSADCLRKAVELDPARADVWRRLGHALRRGGDLSGADSALRQSLAMKPDDPHTAHELGLTLWTQGRCSEAREKLHRAAELEPHDVSYIAAADSIDAELESPLRLAGRPAHLRVAFHMNRPFHHSILRPLFLALRPTQDVLFHSEPDLLRRFNPDVVVCADAQGRRLRDLCPRATIVFTRHGLISKRHLGIAAGGCDYVAGISSDAVRDDIVACEHLPPERLWVTGHVPLDPLFRGLIAPLPPGKLSGSRTVLYAPTWNPRLSSLRLLGDDPVTAIRGADEDINLIIKPHPLISREQADLLRLLRRGTHGRRNVWLVEDAAADALAMLPHADLLLSDASSVILAYLALDRPLVLINHPERHRDPGFDPEGMEWRWRDMAEQVERIPDLPSTIVHALAQPAARAAQRAGYRRLLFGELTDGRAAERITARIESLPRAGQS